MTDPNARQQWDDLLADLGFEPSTPATAAAASASEKPAPAEPAAPLAESPLAETPVAETPTETEAEDAEAPRAKKPRSKTAKTKTGKTSSRSRSESAAEEAPAKPRRRKKATEETAEAPSTPPVEVVAETPATELQEPAEVDGIAVVQPIVIDVPPVNVGEGVLEVVETSETVELTTQDLATLEKQSASTEVVSKAAVDKGEPADKSDSDKSESEKKRRRRRRRSKGRGREETIAPRTIEAAKGRPVAADDEEEADEEVVGETGGGLVPAVEEEDDVEFIDLSDLQVPSWTELVASLYRPPDR